MEADHQKIMCKPGDFIVCQCGQINWYENELCFSCGSTLDLEQDDSKVIKAIKKSYRYYKQDGYTEGEIDDILMEV